MKQETSDLLNSLTSSFCVFLTMFVAVNFVMIVGVTTFAWLGAWAGIHIGMKYFDRLKVW